VIMVLAAIPAARAQPMCRILRVLLAQELNYLNRTPQAAPGAA
jgi:hypothetical protein